MPVKIFCPDCITRTTVDETSIHDGYEFICDCCKNMFYVRIERGLTPRAVDVATGPDEDDFCEHGVIRGECLICPPRY